METKFNDFMNWLKEQNYVEHELHRLIEWWELYKKRQAEQLNKPCVSNNEVAVCDHIYPLNYNMLVPKDHNCIKCGKPRKQTDC
jgi:hypothetical protein